MTGTPTLSDARLLLDAAKKLLDQAVERASTLTEGGKRIDDHQVLVERVAYAVTEGRAAQASLDFAAALVEEGRSSTITETTFAVSVADFTENLRARLAPAVDDLGIGEQALEEAFPAEVRALLRRVGHESMYRTVGRQVIDARGETICRSTKCRNRSANQCANLRMPRLRLRPSTFTEQMPSFPRR